MAKDLENASINDRFNHLKNLILSKPFLNMEGLGNEVPFFICPYKPQETNDIIRFQNQLFNKLEQNGLTILNINLYDLAIVILKERGIWEQVLETEPEVDKEEFKELLQGTLDSATHIIPAISQKVNSAKHAVVFITGVGEVYPYIRSHNILNNMQSTIKDIPMVMFFPGGYTNTAEKGSSLDLFCSLHDDKYYRAFNIYHCEI